MKKLLLLLIALLIGCSPPADSQSAAAPPLPAVAQQTVSSAEPLAASTAQTPSPAVALRDFLYENLSQDDYALVEWINSTSLVLHYINYDRVAACVEQFDGPLPDIAYAQAKYPASLLRPLMREISVLPVICTGPVPWMLLTGEGLEIAVNDSAAYPEIFEWLSSFPQKECIVIFDLTANRRILPGEAPPPAGAGVPEESAAPPPENETLREYLERKLSPAAFSHMEQEGRHLLVYCKMLALSDVEAIANEYDGEDDSQISYLTTRYSRAQLQPTKDEVERCLSELGLAEEVEMSADDFGLVLAFDGEVDLSPFLRWCATYKQRNSIVIKINFPASSGESEVKK